jgi:hypothetical protein
VAGSEGAEWVGAGVEMQPEIGDDSERETDRDSAREMVAS